MTAIRLWLAAACIKLLLLPAYRSTDFEVHRNWLALTHSLPPWQWYYEVTNLEYASPKTVLFQRLSVIAADLLLLAGVAAFIRTQDRVEGTTTAALTIFCFGLLLVDHIHFQYNGFLYGILLLAMACITQRRVVLGSALFAALLNFKHIYLYVAPAFFVYILRAYCFHGPVTRHTFAFGRFAAVGASVLAVFAVSLGPFAYWGQLPQLASRLFPFKRGLCHAYWAPNFWALYNVVDKGLQLALRAVGCPLGASASTASMTGGLVTDEHTHAVLPSVPPLATFLLTVLSMLPALYYLWRQPSTRQFVLAVAQCGMCSFMFGWHVHEKAILLVILPLGLLAAGGGKVADSYWILHCAGSMSLLPLLIDMRETPLKLALFAASTAMVYFLLYGRHKRRPPILSSVYAIGLILLQLLCSAWPYLPQLQRLEFMPLLLTSVYCTVGVGAVWLRLYMHMTSETHAKTA